MNENTSMIDVSHEDAMQVDGGSWCGLAFVAVGALIGGLATGGPGALTGAELGSVGAVLFC